MASINQLRNEKREIVDGLDPLFKKMQRGERLSAAESRELAYAHSKIDAICIEIDDKREGYYASAAQSPAFPATPDFDDSAESRAFSNYVRFGTRAPELRAAGEASGSAGGYLVPPGWWQRLQVAKKAYGGTAADFQQLETDTGQPMNWATNNPTAIVGSLVSENAQVSAVDYTFGQGVLSAYMYTSGVQLVSLQLAHDSAFDIDGFIQARVAESLGRAEAAAAISGTGTNQPLGIVTALAAQASAGTVGGTITANGGYVQLGTAQQVNVFSHTPATPGTGTFTEVTGDLLAPSSILAMIEAVDPAYRALGARWYLNDQQLNGMRSIVDGFGRPLYDSLQGEKPTLYGYEVVCDNNIPVIAASTAGGPVFGHLQSAMVLRRVNQAGLMRLEERYADFLQVGYIGYERIDIRSNDLRAAVTVKAAAS